MSTTRCTSGLQGPSNRPPERVQTSRRRTKDGSRKEASPAQAEPRTSWRPGLRDRATGDPHPGSPRHAGRVNTDPVNSASTTQLTRRTGPRLPRGHLQSHHPLRLGCNAWRPAHATYPHRLVAPDTHTWHQTAQARSDASSSQGTKPTECRTDFMRASPCTQRSLQERSPSTTSS